MIRYLRSVKRYGNMNTGKQPFDRGILIHIMLQ